MKKLLTVVLTLALGISCLGLVACGNKGVEGTYKLYSTTDSDSNETIVVGSKEAQDIGMTEDAFIVEIKGNNKVVITMIVVSPSGDETPWVAEGTWTQKDNVISVVCILEDGEDTKADFILDGNTLTLTEEFTTTVFKKV